MPFASVLGIGICINSVAFMYNQITFHKEKIDFYKDFYRFPIYSHWVICKFTKYN